MYIYICISELGPKQATSWTFKLHAIRRYSGDAEVHGAVQVNVQCTWQAHSSIIIRDMLMDFMYSPMVIRDMLMDIYENMYNYRQCGKPLVINYVIINCSQEVVYFCKGLTADAAATRREKCLVVFNRFPAALAEEGAQIEQKDANLETKTKQISSK